jgi:hypothetical protein
MIPSLFVSKNEARPWSVMRAAALGAAVGLLAAIFKTLGPLRVSNAGATLTIAEIGGAALVFALLCAGAALLRNAIARRVIWPKMD